MSCCPEVGTIFKISEVFLMKHQKSVSTCQDLQYGTGNQVTPGLLVLCKVGINKLVKKTCCVT